MVAHSENISMNGLYNGHMTESHRASIPCPLSANVTRISDQQAANRTYVLNTTAGTGWFFKLQIYRTILIYYLNFCMCVCNNIMLLLVFCHSVLVAILW